MAKEQKSGLMSSVPSAVPPQDLAPRLLHWFDVQARVLPWRHDHHPYRLLVALFMLQQTQVATVLPYYRRFLRAFPTIKTLAAATVEEVLKLWEGLGYYARARHLHQAAQIVVRDYDGRIPDEEGALRALPGVGPYTAAALQSIAFGQPVAAVDGNVIRILARVFWLETEENTTALEKRVRMLAQAAIPKERPGDFNQALMDLGALICTPRQPRCLACPLQDCCQAWTRGQPEALPKRRRSAPQNIAAAAALIWRRGRILMAQRPPEGIWGGLWELPHCELPAEQNAAAALQEYLKQAFGLNVRLHSCCGLTHTYSVANRRFRLSIWEGFVEQGRLQSRRHQRACWLSPAALQPLALPAPHRRLLQKLGILPPAA